MNREMRDKMTKEDKIKKDRDCYAAGGAAKVRKGEATPAGKQIKKK